MPRPAHRRRYVTSILLLALLFTLGRVTEVLAQENCMDGIDNDVDGLFDCEDDDCCADPFCLGSFPPNENSCPFPPCCANGNDDDCDGLVDCDDPDCCAACPPTETSSDGIDNDCDGSTDCQLGNEDPDCPCGAEDITNGNCADGVDNDGDALTDCADPDCAGGPPCPETSCADGIDNDCDGLIDALDSVDCPGADPDADGDGFPASIDCDDTNSAVNPAAAEVCDGLDNNCDGSVDEGNPGSGAECGLSIGECQPGTENCQGGALVCVGDIGPVDEACDSLDNNCDGSVDEGNPSGGAVCGLSIGECQTGLEECQGGALVCVGDIGPVDEACDNLDNNCDGSADEGNPGGGAVCGSDVGECQTGLEECQDGALLCVNDIRPVAEACDNLDNDCDGVADEEIPVSVCGSDVGECQTGVEECVAGVMVCVGDIGPVAETCDGLDNDCDGLPGCADPGCSGDPQCPLPDGALCTEDEQCQSEHCGDGVCCNRPCDGPFEECNLPGQEGTCTVTAPAPVLSRIGLLIGLALLAAVAAFALIRQRRDLIN